MVSAFWTQLTMNGVRVSWVAVKPRMKSRYALKAGRPSAKSTSTSDAVLTSAAAPWRRSRVRMGCARSA